MGVAENDASRSDAVSNAIVSVRTALPKEKTTLEMQFRNLQIRFCETLDAEKLNTVFNALSDANKPVCGNNAQLTTISLTAHLLASVPSKCSNPLGN